MNKMVLLVLQLASQLSSLTSILNLHREQIDKQVKHLHSTIEQIDQITKDLLSILEKEANFQVSANEVSQKDLLNELCRHFSMDEFYELCFFLKIDHESVALSKNKRDFARKLIEYCQRHGYLQELIEQCHFLRPNASCFMLISNSDIVSPTSDSYIDIVQSTLSEVLRKKNNGNTEISRTLLDVLSLLMQGNTNAQALASVGLGSFDLKSLELTAPRSITIQQTHKQRWCVIFEQSLEQLQSIFNLPTIESSFVYRTDDSINQANYITLLRSKVNVEGTELFVTLDALHSIDHADLLELSLITSLSQVIEVSLYAQIEWNKFNEQVIIDQWGKVQFSPVALDNIWDETNQIVRTGLRLSIQPLFT